MSNEILSLSYSELDVTSCIATMAATLAGDLTITACPVNNSPGTMVTVAASAKNIGNISNNSFVIGVTIARADNGAIIKSDNSGNIDLSVGATYTWSTSFIMPTSNVNVVFNLQADPDFNY